MTDDTPRRHDDLYLLSEADLVGILGDCYADLREHRDVDDETAAWMVDRMYGTITDDWYYDASADE
jgi:hypothetical protein